MAHDMSCVNAYRLFAIIPDDACASMRKENNKKQGGLVSAGVAFVTFKNSAHARLVLRKFPSSSMSLCINKYVRPCLLLCSCCVLGLCWRKSKAKEVEVRVLWMTKTKSSLLRPGTYAALVQALLQPARDANTVDGSLHLVDACGLCFLAYSSRAEILL